MKRQCSINSCDRRFSLLSLHAANANWQRTVFTINMRPSFLLWWIIQKLDHWWPAANKKLASTCFVKHITHSNILIGPLYKGIIHEKVNYFDSQNDRFKFY